MPGAHHLLITTDVEVYGVIYRLLNTVTGKSYVGQTIRLDKRIAKYAIMDCKEQPKIYRSISKHGWEAFKTFTIASANSKQELDELEVKCISELDCITNGYNCETGGSTGRPSIETKQKISASTKGKQKSAKHCASISAAKKGKKLSPEHCAKMSKANKGKPSPRKGRPNPLANRLRMRAVICNETGQRFESINEAARQLDLPRSSLTAQVAGHYKHVKGLTFRYA